MKKNECYEMNIKGYSSEGHGVARVEDAVCFVRGALDGETCQALILKVNKNLAFGKASGILKTSPNRVNPECRFFPRCGGCDTWHMNYQEELSFKQEKVKNAIDKFAKSDVNIHPITSSPKQKYYRNKAQFPVQFVSGVCKFGFYRERSHDIIEMDKCLIQSEVSNELANIVAKWATENKIYELRHIYIRTSGEKALLCPVVKKLPNPKATEKLLSLLPDYVESVVYNINNEDTNVVLGKKDVVIKGDGRLEDTFCGNTFRLSPKAFYQVNKAQAENIYKKAIELLSPKGDEIVVDLYSGMGTIAMAVADKVKKVYAIEIVPQAVEDGRRALKENKITNVEFICADAAEGTRKIREKIDAVIVDPPRKGLSPELIELIKELAPEKVIYVSCDVSTLARDIALFEQGDYKAKDLYPFDMFPKTSHVETVVLMSRVKD